jgi:hypothetical protein
MTGRRFARSHDEEKIGATVIAAQIPLMMIEPRRQPSGMCAGVCAYEAA